jgi:hypothetical protein
LKRLEFLLEENRPKWESFWKTLWLLSNPFIFQSKLYNYNEERNGNKLVESTMTFKVV